MSFNKLPPYIVQELPDISDVVNEPLKFGVRIKYTCFDISKKYIVFGATSGGAYIFSRIPCEFIQLIPSKDGPATLISISPDEKYIAIANNHGCVTVTSCQQIPAGQPTSITSKEHNNNEISSMVWGDNLLFIGDDVGNVSVLQMSNFITKTIFQNSSQIIMNLDSRICQLDIRDCMLLVSTLTRCYICDTSKELYRLIGQKLREGKFGACFVTTKSMENCQCNNNQMKEVKLYNIVREEHNFFVNEKFCNTSIYCARPSSRLWEASMDGTVKRTHQYREVLARGATRVITVNECDDDDDLSVHLVDEANDGQSCCFAKIFSLKNAIFSFSTKALYFLNIDKIEDTIWVADYNDIIDCKVYNDHVYVWLQNGTMVHIKYVDIETCLVQNFLDGKYSICAKLIEVYSDYLLLNASHGHLHVLVGLKGKLNADVYERISFVLKEIDERKAKEVTPVKHGVVTVDNTYYTQSVLNNEGSDSTRSSPETLQTIKDMGTTVTDKINNSKKIIKDKLVDFGEKVKNLSQEKENGRDDVIFRESSQKAIISQDINKDICKLLYKNFMLNRTNKDVDIITNIAHIIDNYSSNIKDVYELMNNLELYCKNINVEDIYISNHIFLMYIDNCGERDQILDVVLENGDMYKYFVSSCINVNDKKLNSLGCQCGYPLPYTRSDKTPEYAELLDLFVEKQWLSPNSKQLYEMCRLMPYAWRKILHLRRNEDLMNILTLLLQILDERLLDSFLPQFTIKIWDSAVKLYATLHGNLCLNCNKKFDGVIVKDTLSWDDLGSLMIKSVGGRNAIKIMENNSDLIVMGDLTMKFYNACLMTALFERYDPSTVVQLVDTVYDVYGFADARNELNNLLRTTIEGSLKNTSLPLVVAANTNNWGLNFDQSASTEARIKYRSLKEIIASLFDNNDCALCGLQLGNDVLVEDGGLWVFKCGHIYHGACLDINKIKLCVSC